MAGGSGSAGATRQAAEEVLSGKGRKGLLRRALPFMGPAFVASVAFMDPGNYATNIEGGAQFGLTLLWVVWASNLIAMLVQSLSAKLGIATGRNLAELCRERYPKPAVVFLWLVTEGVAMATDLAEFLGAAVGFQLLLHVPLVVGGLLTAVATFVVLGLERHGFRAVEGAITGFVGVIAICYLVETFLVRPDWRAVAYHSVVPSFRGPESVVLASGILGATVMPHAVFLHSALTQGRVVTRKPEQLRRLFRFELLDVVVALGIAGFVNAAMLVMAASTFHRAGLTEVGGIEQAYQTLTPLLGSAAGFVFALSLLASGLSSAAVGTMSGQVVMQGFVRRQIPAWVRRGVTILPSLVVIALGLEPTKVLVISQVVLSFGLPFALVPLVRFSSDNELMGVLANGKGVTAAAWTASALVIALNVYLLAKVVMGF